MKIPPPLNTALKVGLYNAAAVLLTFLLGVKFQIDALGVVFMILTFPACLISYTHTTPTGFSERSFWFLSPLIWGAASFIIHAVIARRRRGRTT